MDLDIDIGILYLVMIDFFSRTALTKQIYFKSEEEVQPISVAYCFNMDANCQCQM